MPIISLMERIMRSSPSENSRSVKLNMKNTPRVFSMPLMGAQAMALTPEFLKAEPSARGSVDTSLINIGFPISATLPGMSCPMAKECTLLAKLSEGPLHWAQLKFLPESSAI